MPNEKDIFADHRGMMITGEQRDSIMYIVGKLDGIMAACCYASTVRAINSSLSEGIGGV